MFEKEAEEIANKRCHEIMCFGHCSFSSPKHHRCGEWHREYECALKGAEFGYNKANEWHKGELPQVTDKNKGTLYLAWTKYGRAGSPCIVTPLKVKYINLWTGAIVDKEDVVFWKEIELPTE